jgi:uncharacterized protein (TIRG00374 family)
MKTAIKLVASLLISIACLYFASRNVQWAEFRAILASAEIWPLALGVAFSFISFFLRAFRWKILLKPFQDIPALKLLRWQVGGLFVNNLLPLRMGELARAYWTGHKTSIPKSTVLATIVVERASDLISLAVIGMALLLGLGLYQSGAGTQAVAGIGAAALLAGGFWGLRRLLHPDAQEKLIGTLERILPKALSASIEKFLHGLRIVQNLKEFLWVGALSLVIWSSDITVVYIFSHSLDLGISWIQTGVLVLGLVLGVMVPAAPGAAGTYEAGGVAALGMLGVDQTLALSFVLLIHVVQFLVVLAAGIPILVAEGFNPKALMKTTETEN